MDSFEAMVEKACENVELPGVVLVASSADGTSLSLSPH